MMRVHSIHESDDVVFMHRQDIFVNFEADGDGDTFNMVKMPDDLTSLYREYYESEEVKKQLTPINLGDFLPKKKREYNFANQSDMIELASALLRGKNAIREIASIRRIYGQLQDVLVEIDLLGEKYTLIPPGQKVSTRIKPGTKYTVSDLLRIYLQAAVDNGQYMLLDKWGYKATNLKKGLWQDSNKERISKEKWEIVGPIITTIMNVHARNGKIRNGRDRINGSWGTKKTIAEGEKYLAYMGMDNDGNLGIGETREDHIKGLLEMQGIFYDKDALRIKFKDGASNQEKLVVQPAVLYRGFKRGREDGSPFILQGAENIGNIRNGTDYHQAHDYAIEELSELFEEITMEASEKDRENGSTYAKEAFTTMYSMFKDFKDKGIEIEFLGWSYNEKMANFTEIYSKKFNKLSSNAKKIATIEFLSGIRRLEGGYTATVRYPHTIPPVGIRPKSRNLLDPNIMVKYFKLYNKSVFKEDNTNPIKIENKSRHKSIISRKINKRCP